MATDARVTVVGNLGQDAETRYTPNGTMVVNLAVAHNIRESDGSETVNWYRVAAFGKLAEVLDGLARNGAFAKGEMVYVVGRLKLREYARQDGTAGYSLDVSADSVIRCGGAPAPAVAAPQPAPRPAPARRPPARKPAPPDGDVPF